MLAFWVATNGDLACPTILSVRDEFFSGGRGPARVRRNFVAMAMRWELDPVFRCFFPSLQLGLGQVELSALHPQRGSGQYISGGITKSPGRAMVTRLRWTEREGMKMRQIISLLLGITFVSLSPVTWAAGHGDGGGFGGGGSHGGGFSGGFHGGGFHGGGFSGGGHVGGGVRTRGGGVGFGMPQITRDRGTMASAARPSRTFPQRGLNRRTNHIAERHEANWHRDWDRRHAHFDHGHFFVFIDGFWCGLDAGFFPWDYLPYYADDYYPYDYYAAVNPYDYNGGSYDIDSADSAAVQAVQTQLAQLGYYNGSLDGVFGPSTRDAVAKFQIANQLNVTGSLSPDTLQSLGLPQATAT